MPVPVSNYTQIPNAILDAMHSMGEAEFKVVMAIARKTFGWQKTRDRISLSQLVEITNLSRQGVVNGLEQAQAHGWVVKFETPKGNEWEINVVNEVDQKQGRVVNVVDQQVVNVVDTQKKEDTGKKKNEEEERAKRQNFIRCYHDNLGFPSPLVIAELERLATTYTFDQFQTAMSKTLAQGKNSLAYLEGVLKGVGDKPNAPRPAARANPYQAPRVAANGGQPLAQGFKDY